MCVYLDTKRECFHWALKLESTVPPILTEIAIHGIILAEKRSETIESEIWFNFPNVSRNLPYPAQKQDPYSESKYSFSQLLERLKNQK